MHSNTLKTTAWLAGLGGLVVGVVGVLGGGSTNALILGLVLALALVMVGGSYWFSDRLALRAANATVVTARDELQLYGIVARLSQRAGLPMPTVAVCPDSQSNAFATGRGPRHAVVCASRGLLEYLPPDQVEAVMAHELMHVRHRDILIGSASSMPIAARLSSSAPGSRWLERSSASRSWPAGSRWNSPRLRLTPASTTPSARSRGATVVAPIWPDCSRLTH